MVDSVNTTISNKDYVVVYGGAFNPPTNAHTAIATACAAYAARLGGELWLVPSGSRPDKTIDTSTDTRKAFVEAFADELGSAPCRVSIEWSEFDNQFSETITTVERFTSQYPSKSFIWAFGADSFITMRSWRGGEELWRTLRFVAIPRPGYTMPMLPLNAEILYVDTPNISSTEVRQLIAENRPISHLVPRSISNLLVKNRLDAYQA